MIYVDDREGSKELAGLIPDSVLCRLEYADAMFGGNGPAGDMTLGVERKRIGDLIQSIRSGRLSEHQLPGLLAEYDKVYLIVEGPWQANRRDGTVEVLRHGKWSRLGESKFTSKRIWGYLTALNASTGIQVFTTTGMLETVLLITELHQWWGQPWEKHHAHLATGHMMPPAAYLHPGKPSLLRRIASELPGIGWGRVIQVEKHFGTVAAMFAATREQWAEIPGIGCVTSQRAWEALHT